MKKDAKVKLFGAILGGWVFSVIVVTLAWLLIIPEVLEPYAQSPGARNEWDTILFIPLAIILVGIVFKKTRKLFILVYCGCFACAAMLFPAYQIAKVKTATSLPEIANRIEVASGSLAGCYIMILILAALCGVTLLKTKNCEPEIEPYPDGRADAPTGSG